jgi:glyoxylase-like metal-dependent hydrolase (beta-lactamase superfamily II)
MIQVRTRSGAVSRPAFTCAAVAAAVLVACGGEDAFDRPFKDPALALPAAQPAAFTEPAAGISRYQLHLDTATANAGSEFAGEQRRQWCYSVENPGGPPELNDTAVVPMTKMFDNLYFTGRRWVGQFVLSTPTGYFLLDGLNTNDDARTITVPGLVAAGFDPAAVKGIMPTHGHGDHYNGAKYMQATYGATVYTGSLDARAYTVNRQGQAVVDPIITTSIDNAVLTPQTLTVDGLPLTVLSTPGHTAGTMSGILPAIAGGKAYKLAFWGGTGTPTTLPLAMQYLDGAERLYRLAKDQNVDGTIHTHPFVDGSLAKLDKINSGTTGGKNPFLIGNASTLRTLSILRECSAAKVNALDATVVNPVWLTTTTEVVASSQDAGGNRNVAGLVRVQDPYGPVAEAVVTLGLAGASESCTITTDSLGQGSCAFLTRAVARGQSVMATFAGTTGAEKVRLPSAGTQLLN